MMVSSGCIPMWKNGRSRRYLEESYFNKCFRRKTQKKRHIDLYCYLRPRYIFPFEEISWKQRYASAEPSKAWNICNGKRFGGHKDQSFRGQPPVAHKWRTLRGRQPSKTGTIGIQNIVERKFLFFSRSSSFPLTCGGGVIKTQKICNSSTFTLSCSREVR